MWLLAFSFCNSDLLTSYETDTKLCHWQLAYPGEIHTKKTCEKLKWKGCVCRLLQCRNIKYELNVTRQNFRNKNPITSFLFTQVKFDFAVNSSSNSETERKCVPKLLNFDYWLKIFGYLCIFLVMNCWSQWWWMIEILKIQICFQILQLFLSELKLQLWITASTNSVWYPMTPDVPICIYDLSLYFYLLVSLILFLDLHIVLVCHLTLIF